MYQVGGCRHSRLPVTPERPGVWRWVAGQKLSHVALRAGQPRTEPRSSR
jgi:hypothetical protein